MARCYINILIITHRIILVHLLSQVVQKSVKYGCHCEGISASCSLQTCGTTLVNLRTVSAKIYQAYSESCKVHPNIINSDEPSFISTDCDKITNNTMIYFDNSVDYCYRDISVGSPGVKGQSCDPHVTGPGSCSEHCCSRGFVEVSVIEKDECCTFVWCCRIECTTCYKNKKYYFCN